MGTKTVKPLPLTVESFAPFGRVLENLPHAPTKDGDGWSCHSPIDFMITDAPLGVGIVYCSAAPAIDSLERHVSREELLWATTEDLVMLADLPVHLGDPDAKPVFETARAFHIRAGQAMIINRGTWHSPAFAVSGESKYFFLVERKADLVDQDSAPWIPFRGGESITIL